MLTSFCTILLKTFDVLYCPHVCRDTGSWIEFTVYLQFVMIDLGKNKQLSLSCSSRSRLCDTDPFTCYVLNANLLKMEFVVLLRWRSGWILKIIICHLPWVPIPRPICKITMTLQRSDVLELEEIHYFQSSTRHSHDIPMDFVFREFVSSEFGFLVNDEERLRQIQDADIRTINNHKIERKLIVRNLHVDHRDPRVKLSDVQSVENSRISSSLWDPIRCIWEVDTLIYNPKTRVSWMSRIVLSISEE